MLEQSSDQGGWRKPFVLEQRFKGSQDNKTAREMEQIKNEFGSNLINKLGSWGLTGERSKGNEVATLRDRLLPTEAVSMTIDALESGDNGITRLWELFLSGLVGQGVITEEERSKIFAKAQEYMDAGDDKKDKLDLNIE